MTIEQREHWSMENWNNGYPSWITGVAALGHGMIIHESFAGNSGLHFNAYTLAYEVTEQRDNTLGVFREVLQRSLQLGRQSTWLRRIFPDVDANKDVQTMILPFSEERLKQLRTACPQLCVHVPPEPWTWSAEDAIPDDSGVETDLDVEV
ncbi:MAG: hypothetical protein NTW19_07980, partial [Planctomycetota bacterium]|nr:hypothetical protein [Planctomycetota bacterium]